MSMEREHVPFLTIERQEVLSGHLYTTRGGSVVIDKHATCEEHLLAQATHDTQPMYRCRRYLREVIPPEWMDKSGQFLIDRAVTTDGEVVSVTISFLKID